MGDLPPRDVGAHRRRRTSSPWPSPTRRWRASASAAGPIDWHADWRDLLERAPTSTPSASRRPSAACTRRSRSTRCDAGKHVLVEKPIATRAGGRRCAWPPPPAARAQADGRPRRALQPRGRQAPELIAEGRIGRVFRAHATRVGPLPARIRDAGVAIDLATHDLDIMQFVLGRDITRVYAEGAELLASDAGGHDRLPAALRRRRPVRAARRQLAHAGEAPRADGHRRGRDAHRVLHHPGRLVHGVAEAATGWDELARIRGDAEGAALRFALRSVEPLRAELEAFAACMRDDTPEPVTAYDGCRALIAALAVRDSACQLPPVTLLDMPSPAPLARRRLTRRGRP